mgnify:CR=1 FL=1
MVKTMMERWIFSVLVYHSLRSGYFFYAKNSFFFCIIYNVGSVLGSAIYNSNYVFRTWLLWSLEQQSHRVSHFWSCSTIRFKNQKCLPFLVFFKKNSEFSSYCALNVDIRPLNQNKNQTKIILEFSHTNCY